MMLTTTTTTTTTTTMTTMTTMTTTTMTIPKPVYALTACNTSTTSCANSAICKRCLEEVSNGSRAVHCFQTNTQFRLVINTCVSDCAVAYAVRSAPESAEFGCYVSWLTDANSVLQGCESYPRFVSLTQQPPQSNCVSSTSGWSSVEIVIDPIVDSSNNVAAANNTELAVMLAIIIFAVVLFMIIFCFCRRSKQKDTKADVGITVHDDEYDTVINRVKEVADYGAEMIAMETINNTAYSDGYLSLSPDTSGYSDKYMDVTSPSLMLSVPGMSRGNQTGSLTSVLQGKRYLGDNMSFKIADVLPGYVSASPMEDGTYMTSQI
eukprot:m.242583 g.242583  ORF g.242583 m.242583 type:complete len:321 (-) comp33799_c0_seq2:287-1249(-)